MPIHPSLRDVIGFHGEKIVELNLTEYVDPSGPLFRPGFLGDKWPAVDFYVELNGVPGKRPYFLVQVKATATTLTRHGVRITATRKDIAHLLEIPGPTYLFAVHEPSGRVFVKSVHIGFAARSITRVQLSSELTTANLRRLYDEVRGHWQAADHKPTHSVFA